MQRRNIISGIGTVGIAAIAGCSSLDGIDVTSSDGSDESLEDRTYEIGETFVIGEGSNVVEYTVNSVNGARAIGSEISNVKADGFFIIVQLTMENKSNQSFTISSNKFGIIGGTEPGGEPNQYAASTDAAAYADSDERFDQESILFEQLQPDLATDGAVIFDVPTDLKEPALFGIDPASFSDSAEPHYVRVELG